MAVHFGEKETYKGAVLDIHSHMWMDGMEEEWAVVWDMKTHETKSITFGYYGADGSNLAGGRAKIDASQEVVNDVIETLKAKAQTALADHIEHYQEEIMASRTVEVIRGRKVPKGTVLEVFWVGERPTYRSLNYPWMHETETIAGCRNKSGEKIWVKAEYLKPIDNATLTREERDEWVKNWVKKEAESLNIKAELGA